MRHSPVVLQDPAHALAELVVAEVAVEHAAQDLRRRRRTRRPLLVPEELLQEGLEGVEGARDHAQQLTCIQAKGKPLSTRELSSE